MAAKTVGIRNSAGEEKLASLRKKLLISHDERNTSPHHFGPALASLKETPRLVRCINLGWEFLLISLPESVRHVNPPDMLRESFLKHAG